MNNFGKIPRGIATKIAVAAGSKAKRIAPAVVAKVKASATKGKDAALLGGAIATVDKTVQRLRKGEDLFSAVKGAATEAILIDTVTAGLRTFPGGSELAAIYEKIVKNDQIDRKESLNNLVHSAVKPKIKDAIKPITGEGKATEISHAISVKSVEAIGKLSVIAQTKKTTQPE